MTYCVSVLLDSGMVFASDSRTHAGVDNISSFCKMVVLERVQDRVLVVMSAGNLSLTQGTLNILEQQARRSGAGLTMWNATSMLQIAQLLAECLRQVEARDGPYLEQHRIDPNACFLLGGQVKGEQPRLFVVHGKSDVVEATSGTAFFQIGETEYGKPILDRVIKRDTSLTDAVKCVLVSFDSTMRSNVSVGLPIDLCCYQKDSFRVMLKHRIGENDPYFRTIHRQWNEGLRRVFDELPPPYSEDDIRLGR